MAKIAKLEDDIAAGMDFEITPRPLGGPVTSIELEPLVGVIVPMCNASETINATLASVVAQTHGNLDVVIVDDGSTDDCVEKVTTWTQQDPRLRIIRQKNSGVAAARNFGAANTVAEYLAFIDADDLWAPAKIKAQLDTLLNSSNTVGLVYTWHAQIDEGDRVLSLAHRPTAEGWVLREMLRTNFVGNGSSALFRRSAFDRVGRFDPRRTCDGCADLAICLRIAEHYEFRVVRRHLVGYRMVPGHMSSNITGMVESCVTVLFDYHRRYPEFHPEMAQHLDELRLWLLVRAMATSEYRSCHALLSQMWRSSPYFLLRRAPGLIDTLARAKSPRLLKNLLQSFFAQSAGDGERYLERSW